MALTYQILGSPGRDNALLVRVDSGKQVTRLLFDCGDGCVSELSIAEIQAIDHLFFSHLHMDHVGGFDSFFRCTFNRDTKPNMIWGPLGTAAILQHRFQGYWWNLVEDRSATWQVNDVAEPKILQYRFELSEAFTVCHDDGAVPKGSVVLDDQDFTVRALHLRHHGECLGYLVEEKPKFNVQTQKLAELGLSPGPWMKDLKNEEISGIVTFDGREYSLTNLRTELLVETSGESLAYLTDFLLDEATSDYLSQVLHDCQTVVCEAQYRGIDIDLAQRNHHTTTTQVARLAAQAEVGNLLLFHLSDRYTIAEWLEMLAETQAIFEQSAFPAAWQIES